VARSFRGQRFALHDREVQLDLVQPRGVHREMNQPGVRPAVLHPLDRRLARVRGAVVNDPVDGPGGRVRLGGHDLLHEVAERFDPGRRLDPVEQVRVMNIPGSEVRERSAALVLELVAAAAATAGRAGLMSASGAALLKGPVMPPGGRVVVVAGFVDVVSFLVEVVVPVVVEVTSGQGWCLGRWR
jgi:hypothetical protein